MNDKISIVDVAAVAGVSPATVSRVINNSHKASRESVLKVQEAIKSTGYKVIPPAHRKGHRPRSRRPASYRKMQVALISQVKPFLLDTPIYSKVMRGIESELGDSYYNLIVRNLPVNSPWSAIPHKIDGAILFNVRSQDPKLLRSFREMPCVRIMGAGHEHDVFDHVTYNNNTVGRLAAEHLLKNGHKRVVYLGMPILDSRTFKARYESFTSTMENAGATVNGVFNNSLVDESNNMQLPDVKGLGLAIEQIKTLPQMPTAIFAPMDTIVIGLYHTLPHYGIVPGKDIEIIGVNNDAIFLNNFSPRPASVEIHPMKIGREAVKRLFWRMENPKDPLEQIEFEPEIALY